MALSSVLRTGPAIRLFEKLSSARAFSTFRRDPANKGKSFGDFELEWADKTARQDVFGDLAKQADALLQGASGDGQPKSQAAGAVRIQDDADYGRLQSGATYIGPDGQLRRKR